MQLFFLQKEDYYSSSVKILLDEKQKGKTLKHKKPNEEQLKKAIVQLIRAVGGLCIKTHTPGQWAPEPGVSDLIALYDGRTYFIEVKGPRGKVSQKQKTFLATVNTFRNAKGFVAWKEEDVIKELGITAMLF